MDPQKPKIIIVSHCLLNPASRLAGITYPPKFDPKRQSVIQLPCPELIYFGANRREITKDQLTQSRYRKFCHELFLPFADMVEELYKKGFDIEIIGVKKSPSCAVKCTTVDGPGGRVRIFTHTHVSGKGVFFEEIEKDLVKRGIFFIMREL